LYQAYREEGVRGWLLVAAVPVTGLVQAVILSYTVDWSGILLPFIATGTVGVGIFLAALKLHKQPDLSTPRKAVAFIAIALLFIAPFVWACTPLVYGGGGFLPAAGPQLSGGSTGMGAGSSAPGIEGSVSRLAEYLLSHNSGEKWIVAEESSRDAAKLIIETGKPVMALGGFSGTDRILSVDALTDLINEGKVRYFLIPSSSQGGGPSPGNSEIVTWVSTHCTAVPVADWGGSGSTGSSVTAPSSRNGDGTSTPPLSQNMSSGQGTFRPSMADRNTLYDCSGYVRPMVA
jgi:4-amino-4-deoxy-L-arabinose transferase-like glycosyltransferase